MMELDDLSLPEKTNLHIGKFYISKHKKSSKLLSIMIY